MSRIVKFCKSQDAALCGSLIKNRRELAMRYAQWSVILFVWCVLCSDPLSAENQLFTFRVEPQRFSSGAAGFVVSWVSPEPARLTVQVFWQDPDPPRTIGRVGMDVHYAHNVLPRILEAGRMQFYQNTGTPQQKLLNGMHVVAMAASGETRISASFSNEGLDALETNGFEVFTIFAEITGSNGSGLWKALVGASVSVKNIRAVKEVKPLPSPSPDILPKQDPASARPRGV